MFELEHGLAEANHVIHRQLGTKAGVQHVDRRRQTLGDVQRREAMNRQRPVESMAAVAIWRLRDSSTCPSLDSGSTLPPTLSTLAVTA